MTPDQEEQFGQLFDRKLNPLVKRIDDLAGQRFLALIATVLALLIAVGALVTLLLVSNRLTDQIDINREYGCAAANTSAASPVKPLEGETRDQFINRMIARRGQLLQAANLRCTSLDGFDTFPFVLGRALHKIDTLLQKEAPTKLRHLEAEDTARGSPSFFSQPDATIVEGSANGSVPPAASGDSPGGTGPTKGASGSPAPKNPPASHPHNPPTKTPSHPAPEETPPPTEEAQQGSPGTGTPTSQDPTPAEEEAKSPASPEPPPKKPCTVEALGVVRLCLGND